MPDKRAARQTTGKKAPAIQRKPGAYTGQPKKAPQKSADPTRLPDPKDVAAAAQEAEAEALAAFVGGEGLPDNGNKAQAASRPTVTYRVVFNSSRRDELIEEVYAVDHIGGMLVFMSGENYLPARMMNTSSIKDVIREDA